MDEQFWVTATDLSWLQNRGHLQQSYPVNGAPRLPRLQNLSFYNGENKRA